MSSFKFNKPFDFQDKSLKPDRLQKIILVKIEVRLSLVLKNKQYICVAWVQWVRCTDCTRSSGQICLVFQTGRHQQDTG